jgi:uncharacterized protein YndB with AHSA1/START domain
METFVFILLILVVAVGALLAYAATKPNTFRIERSLAIKAPPERIFPLINDFRHWRSWSPWENIDPELKREYGGAPSGRGAAYAWVGNKNVGQGRMEIVASVPPSKIVIMLDFLKPFEAHNTAEFTLAPAGEMTNVTWAMNGPNLFIGKLISVFMSMDKMVGKPFEQGLAKLKSLTET